MEALTFFVTPPTSSTETAASKEVMTCSLRSDMTTVREKIEQLMWSLPRVAAANRAAEAAAVPEAMEAAAANLGQERCCVGKKGKVLASSSPIMEMRTSSAMSLTSWMATAVFRMGTWWNLQRRSMTATENHVRPE